MNAKTILIIDDDPSILKVFSSALTAIGYHVVTAQSGDEGLAAARQYLPDLILSDVNMPGIDGKVVLKTLRNDPDLGTTQIVLMTGQPQATTPRLGMDLGADDFLVKPFGLKELRSCVEARLQRSRVHWRVEEQIISQLRGGLRRTLPHEFFTPLAGIIGLTDVLRAGWREMEPAEVDDILAELDRSGWRLQRTLRNYLWSLDLRNAAADGNGNPEPAQILPAEQVCECIADQVRFVSEFHRRSSDVETSITPVPISVDRQNLEIIVSELIDNAFSFSAQGTPVRVALSGEGVFSVADRGRGMNAEQVSGIQAFKQFDRATHEQQGLGLGLSLTQKLIAESGAHFSIESATGEGTVVEVRFRTGS